MSTEDERGERMGKAYRGWEERRQIIRAIIADTSPPSLQSFDLSQSEQVYYRARAARAVDKLARSTSNFKGSYALPTNKPFAYVIVVVTVIVTAAISAGIYVFLHTDTPSSAFPVFAALGAAAVAALGWAVVGWIGHRNTVRQNTNNMLFARFSHAPFGDALHRFHTEFGYGLSLKVTSQMVAECRESKVDEKMRAAAAVSYILNYYELLSAGVLRGDLNKDIVRDNVRGLIIHYYDKCEPHILAANALNHRTFANLIKMRTHYREP
ncbi:DUF4760 domain-containing protein [Croceibacterium mercuriale]|uniref:DUF4760 domain-containing protein n=1 Tax=Croceibacterium mercuriale TaxID=1572751 RepID=UPI0009E05154|nr:DUF4760 domain-containing protein [Croceibacterium mercuriale]